MSPSRLVLQLLLCVVVHIVIMVVLILLLRHLSCIIVVHTGASDWAICMCILSLTLGWGMAWGMTLVRDLPRVVLSWVALLGHELLIQLETAGSGRCLSVGVITGVAMLPLRHELFTFCHRCVLIFSRLYLSHSGHTSLVACFWPL